ncbi:hypothetical protein OPQ81_009300 [Rhizoctonia solani]|nr:hypothetical protein OPQ81_009300 [Rhizoctonia solani]
MHIRSGVKEREARVFVSVYFMSITLCNRPKSDPQLRQLNPNTAARVCVAHWGQWTIKCLPHVEPNPKSYAKAKCLFFVQTCTMFLSTKQPIWLDGPDVSDSLAHGCILQFVMIASRRSFSWVELKKLGAHIDQSTSA